MIQDRRAVIVGIFTLLGLGILIVTILTLGGQKKIFSKAIHVKAIFNDVQGLKKGNNVWFSGVKIGTIRDISFHGKSQVIVDMNIEEASSGYIRKDAVASISSDGFIGDRIISIAGGSPQFEAIEDGDMLAVLEASTTDQMMSTLQNNNLNLLDITENFKKISANLAEGKGTIGKLLNDEDPYRDFQAIMANLRETARKSSEITASLQRFSARLNQPGGLANDLATDTIIFAKLRSTATELERLSQNANAAITEFQTAGASLNEGLENPSSPVGVLLKNEQAARNIQQILENLETGSKKLDENLEALQHNFLFRGFFKKKRRAEEAAQ